MIFFQHSLNAPLPLSPFSARSAPFSAPVTLRSQPHMLWGSSTLPYLTLPYLIYLFIVSKRVDLCCCCCLSMLAHLDFGRSTIAV